MPIIIALGSNLGNKLHHLELARNELSQSYRLIKESRIYRSAAVDYEAQPEFYNQVCQFETPHENCYQVLENLLQIEAELGRRRDIPKGPRTIDLDLLFYDLTIVQTPQLCLPHPRLWSRGFVVKPLSELPYFTQLQSHFFFSDKFIDDAAPL